MFKELRKFGGALLQGDFQSAFKYGYGTYPIDPGTYRGTPDGGDGWAMTVGNGDYSYFKYDGLGKCIEAYEKCPAVSAIINKKAQSFIDGRLWVMNSSGKEAKSPEATALRKLLKKPNLLQSWDEFIAQTYIYVQLFGFCPIITIKRTGFPKNIDAKALWNIPPNFIDFEYTQRLYKQTELGGVLSHIYVQYNGERIPIPTEDICIIRDISPALTGNMVFPDNRIRSLQKPINNSIGAFESRNVLINYRGALGIFSKDTDGGGGQGIPSIPITDTEKRDLQEDFKKYGLRGRQWQFIITTAALKWQSISVPTKDLLLFEEVDAGTMAVADRYNYPYQLMAAAKGTTYSNVAEGNKILYQGAILPEAKSIFNQLSEFFKLSEYNLTLDMDYSAVAVLQKDKVQEATARRARDEAYKIEWDNDVCTLDEWRIANGEDPIPVIGGLRRSQLMAQTEQPLIASLGIGGTQAVIEVVTNPSLSEDAAAAILEILFNIPADKARRMVAGKLVNMANVDNNETSQTETAEAA
jgi:hypothetical protein